MVATPYKPVVFSGEALSQAKLQQLANNQQWIFENTPRVRYSSTGLVRDSGVKVMSGKSPFAVQSYDNQTGAVYFGSFFTAGCHPAITCTVETTGGWLRKYVSFRSFGAGTEVDHTGFIWHVVSHEDFADRIEAPGWVHWIAVGY